MRVVNAAEKHVVAADEGLRSLTEVGAELADVLYLNVAFNSLEDLHGVEQARSLQMLDVSHNALKGLSETAVLCHLRVLKCSHNDISGLSWVTPLANLRELWVDHNSVRGAELEHLGRLSKLTWLVVHPNPCTQIDDYIVSIVKRLPGLTKIDATVVDQELRDRAERCEPIAEAELDALPLTPPANAPEADIVPERLYTPPPAASVPVLVPAKPKKMTAEEFMRNFPVQNFIPVEANAASHQSDNDGERTDYPASDVVSDVPNAALETSGPTTAPQASSPREDVCPNGERSPAKRSPQKESPVKKEVIIAQMDSNDKDAEGGVSSILGAVLSLPTFGADSFLKKQPASKTPVPKKPKAAATKSATAAAGSGDNSDAFRQDPVAIMYPNSTVAAVNLRSDGSAVAKWPSGTVAVSVDKEPGGFRIYAAHKDGTIALSFDPAGVGFINYYPSGRMMISTSSSGDGLLFSSDGSIILRQWDATGAMRDDKYEATESLGDESDGALLYKLSDNLAIRVHLLSRRSEAQRNPIALRVFFASSSGIRRVFVNRPNAVSATESKDEFDAIFGKEPEKTAAKAGTSAPPPIAHTDLLGEIRAAVAGL